MSKLQKINLKLLHLFFGIVFIVLACLGAIAYKGSLYIFTLFSLVFLFLVIDLVKRRSSLGYKFLVAFLFLGYWLKLISHLLLKYGFLEPVGDFDNTSRSWDLVLLVSLVGALGVILANIFFTRLCPLPKNQGNNTDIKRSLNWYPKLRLWLWFIVFISIFCVAIIHFNALLPYSPLLPWPFQGLIVWFLGFGLIAIVTCLIRWDEITNFNYKVGFVAVLLESLLSSASLISRSIYIFHTIPLLIEVFSKRLSVYFSKFNKFLILVIWSIFFIVSISSVMLFRYSSISPLNVSSDKSLAISSVHSFSKDLTKRVSYLFIDRWIGLEGVMTVVGRPEKSLDIFFEKIFEVRSAGYVDSFTKEAYSKININDNTQKNVASTGSGSVALFYFSGSLLLVFVGMASLVFLLLSLERAAFFLTSNRYLCAIFSMGIAQSVVSLSVGITPTLTYYATSFVLFFLIYILDLVTTYFQRKDTVLTN